MIQGLGQVYEGGSKSFRPDIQKLRQTENPARDSAICGEVIVSVCVEIKGDCIEK